MHNYHSIPPLPLYLYNIKDNSIIYRHTCIIYRHICIIFKHTCIIYRHTCIILGCLSYISCNPSHLRKPLSSEETLVVMWNPSSRVLLRVNAFFTKLRITNSSEPFVIPAWAVPTKTVNYPTSIPHMTVWRYLPAWLHIDVNIFYIDVDVFLLFLK